MAKKKKSTDVNVIAHDVLQALTAEPLKTYSIKESQPKKGETKNPAAIALGRLGGLKGGKARAAKLSAKNRADIAKNAAASRWRKGKKQ